MPTLDHVTVCGYKTLKELRNFHLNRINVLIGGNGSGKSNFLDFSTWSANWPMNASVPMSSKLEAPMRYWQEVRRPPPKSVHT